LQQKKKLESQRKSVTEQTRGTKRAADSNEELPDEDTSSGSISPAANACKKLKMKQEAHRQPTTVHTRGDKRRLFEIEIISKFSRATKRVMILIRVKFGGVVYFPFPFMRPWSAPILLKTPNEKEGLDSWSASEPRTCRTTRATAPSASAACRSSLARTWRASLSRGSA
jgi:hypothetical protein